MNPRVIFALGAAAACAALGTLASGCLSRRLDALSQWDKALARMDGAVRHRQASALEAVSQGAQEETVTLPALLEKARNTPGQTPAVLLRELPWHPLLPKDAKAALTDWLLSLFLPTAAQQTQGMALAQLPFSRCLNDARAAKERCGRLYVSLGWLAGAALFILLC